MNTALSIQEIYKLAMSQPTERAKYETFVRLAREQGAANAHVDPVLLVAADAYDAATACGAPSSEQIRMLVDAASHPLERVWLDGVRILMRASEQWNEAAQAILIMSKSNLAHVRFNAICSLGPKTPSTIIDAVSRAGLTDRSARVRWKAADRAASLQQFHLEPDIEAAIKEERSAKALRSMTYDLQRLRNARTGTAGQ